MKLKKKEVQSVSALVLLRRGDKMPVEGNAETMCGAETGEKGHSETAPPGDPFHIQLPNPNTIRDANKCLLTGARYSCLLRGSAST